MAAPLLRASRASPLVMTQHHEIPCGIRALYASERRLDVANEAAREFGVIFEHERRLMYASPYGQEAQRTSHDAASVVEIVRFEVPKPLIAGH